MDIMKNCIYCSADEITPITVNNKSFYLHCHSCKKSYTVKEAVEYCNLSPAQKVCYRYNYFKNNNDI